MNYRNFIRGAGGMAARLAAGAGLALSLTAVHAQQNWPNHTIRFVVGNPPGGTTDLMARILADKLKDKLGQPIIIDTRAGAASLVALEYVYKQPADGYTFLVCSSSISTLFELNAAATYKPGDYTPISGIAIAPFLVMVRGDFPVRNLAEFIAYAKANPGKINVGAAGNGSFDHLAGALFALKTNTKMTWVAYKGEAAAVTDLIGGRVDAAFLQWGTSGPHIMAGKIRVLAALAPQRDSNPVLANIPTAAELGSPVDAAAWFALYGPAGLPRDMVERINRESVAILQMPDTVDRIRQVNQQPMVMTPEQLADLTRKSSEEWGGVIKAAGIKGQ